jgi:hypothetical protein
VTQKQLLKTYGYLIGKILRMPDGRHDRIIIKVLHEEPGGVCVESRQIPFSSGNYNLWLPGSIPHSGYCNPKRDHD